MNERCRNCGTEVPDGANYCHQCGRPISKKEAPEGHPQRRVPPHNSNAQEPVSAPTLPLPVASSGDSNLGTRFNRVGGLAAIVDGILLMASIPLFATWTAYYTGDYGNSIGIFMLLGLYVLLLALALPALRRLPAGRSGKLALAGFVLAMIGVTVLVFGTLFTLQPFFPAGGTTEEAVLEVGVVLFLAGIFIFGIAMARANVRPRWAALMLALGTPLIVAPAILSRYYLVQTMGEAPWGAPWSISGVFIGLMVTGVGLTRLGFTVWAPSKTEKLSKRVWRWAGLGGKKGWDWLQLLIAPLAIAVIGFWFTAQQDASQQKIENQRVQDTALQSYFDQMSNLMVGQDAL